MTITNAQWDSNRETLRKNMGLFRTEMSEIARLFQRIVLMGSGHDIATLKALLADFKGHLEQIVDDIESRRR